MNLSLSRPGLDVWAGGSGSPWRRKGWHNRHLSRVGQFALGKFQRLAALAVQLVAKPRWPVWLQEVNTWFNKGTTMGVCSSAEVASEASPEDVRYCEEGIAKLREDPNCESLLRKALTDEVLEEIKTRKTSSFNSTLKDVIQSGVENPDSGIGVYAPDAEAYFVFAPLFDPIIEAYHGGFGPEDKHPPSDFGDTSHMEDLDPEGKYVVSTR